MNVDACNIILLYAFIGISNRLSLSLTIRLFLNNSNICIFCSKTGQVINPNPDKGVREGGLAMFFKGLHIFQIAFMTLLLGPRATVYTFERPDWVPVNPCFQ